MILRKLLSVILILILANTIYSQDKKNKKAVIDTWACDLLINNQTVASPYKGQLRFNLHHRFGKIKKISDLFGIYVPSNVFPTSIF